MFFVSGNHGEEFLPSPQVCILKTKLTLILRAIHVYSCKWNSLLKLILGVLIIRVDPGGLSKSINAFATKVNADFSLGTFVYLNRTRYDVSPDLTILGCTLWSSLNPADLDILSWSLTDFKRIEGFDPEAYTAQHNADLQWLNDTIERIAQKEPKRKIVVFTHHAPTRTGTGDPKYDDGPTNSAFATELSDAQCWATGNIVMWAFGHTHWCCDFMRNGVRVYANQRGYANGRDDYHVEKAVEI